MKTTSKKDRRDLRVALIAFLLLAISSAMGQVSSGTAFAVAPQLLITNLHVVSGCATIEVLASDGRRVGSVVNSDPQLDLALLRVSGLKGASARIRNPRTIRLGETVMVFGFPLSGSLSSGGNFTSGLVSALQGLRNAAGEVQITAPVQPGNSGGPLMDAAGNVIGVVSSKLDALRSAIASGDIPQNINFAISLDVLADFLVSNKVPFGESSRSTPLDTARVAEMAQEFTYRVECNGKLLRSERPPIEQAHRSGTCSPPYDRQLWNDCVGTLMLPNGDKYVGNFKDGKRSGQGVLTSPEGYILKSGTWKNDKLIGGKEED